MFNKRPAITAHPTLSSNVLPPEGLEIVPLRNCPKRLRLALPDVDLGDKKHGFVVCLCYEADAFSQV